MKVKTRLLLTLCTLPILLLVLVISGWMLTSHLNDAKESIQKNFDMSIAAGQIRADIKDEAIYLRNIVIYDEEAYIKEELASLDLEAEKVKKNIDFLQSNVITSEQKELVATLITKNNEFELYKAEVIALVQDHKRTEALELIGETSAPIHREFSQVLTEIATSFDTNLGTSLEKMLSNSQKEIILYSILLAIGIIAIIVIIAKNIMAVFHRIHSMSTLMTKIANHQVELDTKLEVIANDEFDEMAKSFNAMTDSLELQIEKEKEVTWQKANIADITTSLSGTIELETLGQTMLSKVVPLVEASHAVFYVKDLGDPSNETYKLASSFALKKRNQIHSVQRGEGLIGQAIIEKQPILLDQVPADYISISSGLGEASPLSLYVLPIQFKGEVNAVLELASFKRFTESEKEFLKELINNLGIVLESVMGRIQLAKLLEESQTLMEEIQAQSEELQNQQEELRMTNEELEEQTQALRQSEEKLQMQQEELEQTNAELEEKAKKLEEQNIKYEQTNREVEEAKTQLEIKAEQLALSSKYKSEFLANMSHELRTPLNSLLILSKLLADNPNGNLTEKQVEYSKTIYSSGNDLLMLINDILDLAKIESGKTEVMPSEVSIQELVDFMQGSFKPIANDKKVAYNIIVHENVPTSIYSDKVRIQQVLKNLLSNAFKFTAQGEVVLEVGVEENCSHNTIVFTVSDTGIGIAKEKQNLIFEAFQQADGTTSRKFGGTGLGLSISREIVTLLGGEITVESEEGKGSKFTFIVGDFDNNATPQQNPVKVVQQEVASTLVEPLNDQTEAVTKKIALPTVQVASENNHIKRLLIVDDDLNQRNSLMELIGDMDFIIKAVSSGKEAMDLLKVNPIDCMILDLGLTDTNGFDLLEEIKNDQDNNVKVFIYTGRDLTSKEELQLNKYAHTIIIKNEFSPTRLKEELELYLHDSHQQEEQSEKTQLNAISSNKVLTGKKILLVDDDVRNVFALSTVLEMAGMEVIFAENGYESLDVLKNQPDIDLVLMDIMMPEMDGYEAIQRIRQQLHYTDLPIIALTAKAMKEDREKCLAIGASDYIAKPVDTDQLISLIKVWLY